ncbi:efflux transporter outer membrane subunit [Phyllobacterium chamaecytisi]|uniref:efflux transporter outer membrane subunit n=1 Tax=Phyllobacterium chamaecytisi TaxID=2876082 RepID=UPI00351DA793
MVILKGRSLSRIGVLAVSSALVHGCIAGPDYVVPSAPRVTGYTVERHLTATSKTALAGGASQSFAGGQDIPGEWWLLFRSRRINAFVAEAIRNHPDVQAAQFALRSAREKALAEQGGLFPQADGSASVTREKTTPTTPPTTSPYTLYNASVSVNYALDVFGGTRRQIESLRAQADYQRFQLEATFLALTANVVTAAITDASLRAQMAATQDIIKSETEQLTRVRGQFLLGAVPQSDVLSQQATLAETQATLPPLQKQLAQQRNQLMAYLGRLPSEDRGESVDLSDLHLPRALPVGLPSLIVRQRPDIRLAEATLHQATANVGVAVANMLPQITLSGSYGSNASSQLFSADTIAWNVAASVTQKIFDGGTLYHTKEAEVATYQQNLAKYKSAVITAFQNVADGLRAVQFDADALKAQAASEKASLDSLKIAQEQYKSGAVAYVTVVNAQQTYQNARISRVKAQAMRFTDTAALFQALGGGWWNRVDETPDAAPRVQVGYLAGPNQSQPLSAPQYLNAKETAR